MLKNENQKPAEGLFGLNSCCLTDAITLISKDEVEGSAVSKNEANQVTEETATDLHIWNEGDLDSVVCTDWSLFCPQFLVAEEKKEEAAAPPAEDTGDVDDLASGFFIVRCLFYTINI